MVAKEHFPRRKPRRRQKIADPLSLNYQDPTLRSAHSVDEMLAVDNEIMSNLQQ
ncbi:hypothetical protein PISMIDRAFT_671881 [Pisolithus microcarpus 441]|uniref:Uncharacterized protein n=1 Tax=Pisolithus microcarpus 441 TaxID=765257 RepID=A0A0D0ACR0_9AGAM|nr:hypothetical protein PISMIDRAFT_671881 [Pisolithus microcarpus 441]